MNAITTPARQHGDGSASTTPLVAGTASTAVPEHQTFGANAHASQRQSAPASPAAETPARGTPVIYTRSGALAQPVPATNTFGSG